VDAAVVAGVAVAVAAGVADALNPNSNPSITEALMRYPKSTILSSQVLLGGAVLMLSVVVASPLSFAANRPRQAEYPSAQQAVEALMSAVKTGDVRKIVDVLGPEGRELASSGDPVADAAARERFTTAYDEAHQIKQGDTRATLVIGKDDFPFPIPLVAANGVWRFDTAEGVEEILDRRIGENEISAIEVLRAAVDAQREYAEADRDGKGVQYARRLLSSDGTYDGLYWPTEDGERESPLGPLVGYAQAQGYTARQGRPTPYHGYIFRVLTAQGPDAKGGARDYIVNGRMIGGFALVASPAEYGNSGVMTFIVNHDGDVYQRDLGPNTARIAAAMRAYDPDASWREVSR
jgi:hypothetical protein